MKSPMGNESAHESRLRYLLNHPLSTYYLIGGSSVLLLLLGLVMVLSASSIESFKTFGSSYTLFGRQALFGGIGLVGLYFAARTS
ncbi:MAG: putative lipid II flippase FtsW, partial [Actinobacteria bacterium]|nr:putative lipid II flippase FtsW [Actinomycetota bacterium]